MYFKLKKPQNSKEFNDIFLQYFNDKEKMVEIISFTQLVNEPEYLFWDKVKFKEPSPGSINKNDLWQIVKLNRRLQSLESCIVDKDGNSFDWVKLSGFEKIFHELDMNTGGEMFVSKAGIDRGNKQKLISRGIMDEAIASSQLEGAATSRKAAKEMLREGRKPRNASEQMIVNTYLSMREIEETYKNQKMNFDLLLELHQKITDNTKDDNGDKPKLRKDGDNVFVRDSVTGDIYHEAPNAKFVKKELDRFIKFANDELESDVFVHPVIKAIMLHFWLAYLHPFTDGNGRLARLVFYWYLLRQGYWGFAYLPISKIIKRSPSQYKMAYVYSEQDDNDLTYFIDYNIRKIKLAMRDFVDYLEKNSLNNIRMKKKAELKYKFNERQIYLLQHLSADLDERTTTKIHENIYQVSKMTAVQDLKELVEQGFLIKVKQGRNIYYCGTDKIKELF